MPTVKPLRKLAAQIQAGASYEEDSMVLLPFVSSQLGQGYDPIEDESNVGNPFKNIPQKGPLHTGGSNSNQLDAISCIPLLEAAFGSNASKVFTLGSNSKVLSFCALNSVSAIEYGNAYLRSITISGSSGGNWMLDFDLFSVDAENRVATSSFPSATSPGDPFTFHEAGGTGFFRVGDDSDALGSSDEFNIEEFSLTINCGFDEQFCNEGVGTLAPEFGMTPPSVEGSFKLSRHDSDAFLDWEDAWTALQASLYVYKSVTKSMLIEIPRFVAEVNVTDDDTAKQDVTMHIGRNGLGTSYDNSNMAFTSPVRITIVNS